MSAPKFASVEEYLSSLDPTKATTIRRVMDFIVDRFPQLASRIAWNVPTIHLDGEYVVGICAYQDHLTFSPWSAQIIEEFKPRLEGYKLFKNCFHLPVDWQVDQELVADLVRARLAQLD